MFSGNKEVIKQTAMYLFYAFEKQQTMLMNNCNLNLFDI